MSSLRPMKKVSGKNEPIRALIIFDQLSGFASQRFPFRSAGHRQGRHHLLSAAHEESERQERAHTRSHLHDHPLHLLLLHRLPRPSEPRFPSNLAFTLLIHSGTAALHGLNLLQPPLSFVTGSYPFCSTSLDVRLVNFRTSEPLPFRFQPEDWLRFPPEDPSVTVCFSSFYFETQVSPRLSQ